MVLKLNVIDKPQDVSLRVISPQSNQTLRVIDKPQGLNLLKVINQPKWQSKLKVVNKPQGLDLSSIKVVQPKVDTRPIKVTGAKPTQRDERSVFEAFGEGWRSGVLQTSSAVNRILSVGIKKAGNEEIAKRLENIAVNDSELSKYSISVRDDRKFREKWNDPNFISQGIAQNLPNLLFAMGVAAPATVLGAPALVTGGLAFGVGGTLEAGFAYNDAKEFGVDDKTAEKVAGVVGVANGILETIPITKLLTRTSVGKGVKRKIIQEITRRVVTQTLLEGGTESLEEIVQNSVAKVYDEERSIFSGVSEAAFFGGLLGGGTSLVFDIVNNEEVKKYAQKAFESEAGFAKIPGISNDLLTEARKYKSAEEFVKAQGTPVYHGTSLVNAENIDKKGFSLKEQGYSGKPIGASNKGEALSFSKKQSVAEIHAIGSSKRGKGGTVLPVFIDKNAKIFSTENIPAEWRGEFVTLSELDTYARINGFDGIDLAKLEDDGIIRGGRIGVRESEVTIWNKDILKTKSQLTDIWNKANKQDIKLLPGQTAIQGDGFFMSEGQKRAVSSEVRIRRENEAVKKEFAVKEEKQKVRAIKQETMDRAKQIYDKKVSQIKDSKEILNRRRQFIAAIKKQFGLSDADLKSITRKDIRLMSNLEFKKFLDDVRIKSQQLADWKQAKNELMSQIQEKELDIEPLRQAMKLPPISQMSIAQLKEFDEVLQPYQKGDIFLSKRKLELIDNTELSGIKTYREARERLAKKLGVSPDELDNIKVKELDRFTGASQLAEKNPFYKMMVENTTRIRLIRDAEFLEMEQTLNKLAKKLRTTLGQKLIPQQKNIRKWFEAENKNEVELTPEEAEVVKFMQDEWIKARDYLIKHEAMKRGINSDNYFTHIRRGILEAVKEDGIIQAFKELFTQYKQDELVFNILDSETGQILALEKFFKFALRRTGTLKPTENIVDAFRIYMRTFKRKQALDEMVPLIDIYAHTLTPKGMTEKGLLLHNDLIRFTKEWLNTQKGRRVKLLTKQGGMGDLILRGLKAFTTFLDLGFNLPVSVATQVGEQVITYQLLGPQDYIRSKIRAATPKGKRIIKKYQNFIGKNPWKELIEPARQAGNRLAEGIFILFSDANYRRSRNFLLGSMTKEEWASETLSPERLAQLKIAEGRYGMVSGMGSIIGATPEAKVYTQYKSWALPILGSMARNVANLSKVLVGKKPNKRTLTELYRLIEVGAIILVVRSVMEPDEEDDSIIGQIKKRAYTELTTLYQALDPKLWLGGARLISWVNDLGTNLNKLIRLEQYEQSKFGEYEAGELKGLKGLERMFTPRLIKQFQGEKVKELSDIKKEILNDIESGTLSVSAAKEKFISEVKKLEQKERDTRFELPYDEYRKELARLIESKEMTVTEAKEEFIKYRDKKPEEFESKDEKSFIEKVILYAKAIGTDPVTAFTFMFTGEKIRRLDNGTIIVERIPVEESEAIKKQRGATSEMILDHTIPLQLGGSNSEKNLKLVPLEDWERYTIVENYLGNKLRAELITKEEAQDLIQQFKNGQITEEQILNK